ncbi:MAG: Mur ligase family protein, partial [Bacteroidota bacterium]
MKSLKDILYGVGIIAVNGTTDRSINAIHFDSRKVAKNDVFIAIKGSVVDGHRFIDKALEAGASTIICEEFPQNITREATYVEVQNGNSALSIMASNYFDNPSKNLNLVGVTGTNGKTTVSSLLYQLFKKAGYKVGLISTIRIMVDDMEYPTNLTTPDAITINKHLALMNQAG